MNDRNFVLRPEAGAVPLPLLTDSQTTALKNIVAALSEAQRLAVESQDQGSGGDVDPDRVSRLYFVSGEPGSGKSTLYLTLQDIVGENTISHGAHKTHKLSKEDRDQYKKECPDLNGLTQGIRWLEQIDLEVAGDEGENLLAAVLVRISRALSIEPRGSSLTCQKAIDQLEELANDIGIAWDGNLQARASSLDPSSYSQEVMSAQRARLGTNNRLRVALETLSNERCYGCTPETLFVLPIDDFYLKPTVSLELLRLLRMISIPRLFFLIMGDVKTMEALFFEKALADWTHIAGPQVFGSLKKRRKNEVLSRAREMSARYLRKLLPIRQRASISTLTWSEALNYRPPVRNFLDVSQFSDLLSDVTLHTDASESASNLLHFLLTETIWESYRAGAETASSGQTPFNNNYYTALQILEAMPRDVMDMWMTFYELNEQKQPIRWQGSPIFGEGAGNCIGNYRRTGLS